MSAVAIDYRNNTTGFVGRAVTMLSHGLNRYASANPTAAPGQSVTVTITVYAPNGKVADTGTTTVTG
jgi:hypothetical protein